MGAAILTLAWPVLAESFLNALVGLTDTVLSTAISNAATDAVSGAAYVNWFMGLVVQSLGLGATALISRAVGGNRLGVANAALGQSVLLALPKVAPKSCADCAAKLDEALKAGAGDTTLGDLNAETEVLRSYFSGAVESNP